MHKEIRQSVIHKWQSLSEWGRETARGWGGARGLAATSAHSQPQRG